jgi:hypothetical protein
MYQPLRPLPQKDFASLIRVQAPDGCAHQAIFVIPSNRRLVRSLDIIQDLRENIYLSYDGRSTGGFREPTAVSQGTLFTQGNFNNKDAIQRFAQKH